MKMGKEYIRVCGQGEVEKYKQGGDVIKIYCKHI